jgi:hypothetical protein
LDVDNILRHAGPVLHQHGHEIQPFGQLVKLPIALAEPACRQSVDNLKRTMARQAVESGDDGTNDLIVSEVIRTNELQVWFVAEHVVDTPAVRAG